MAERKLKFWRGHYCGRWDGLVIAKNQKDAAVAIGSSVHEMRNFWSAQDGLPPDGLKPNTLYTRKLDSRKDDPWHEGRCPS